MNTLSIAWKEMKHDFRDFRTMIFLLAFPILLMLILGFALTNVFNGDVSVDNLKVLVKNTSTGQLSEAYTAFAKGVSGQSGITFDDLKAGVNGREEVEQNRYADYIEVSDSGIHLYGSSRSPIESNIVQGMLSSFADKYNAAAAVEQQDPAKAELIIAATHQTDYIKDTAINADRQPGSIDYYAIAMTVMIGMWGAMTGGSLIRSEIVHGTAARLAAAPVRKSEIFMGKVLGSVVLNMLCVFVIVMFSKYVFKAYWGNHLPLIFLILLTEVIMSISLGLFISYMMKGEPSGGIVMIIVQLASFLGGAYFPMGDDTGGFLGSVTNLSPIRWGNQALTEIVYNNALTAALPVMLLNMGLAVLFLGAAAMMMHRKEGI
ncbi:ABC transporter permease [Paenibacillus dokdonensis]|uniref:ABC transporter permease n=1 Tax=Paenibacillus dokdonensis TaxID=2567944 RepID=UPI0010A7FE93|nr:ABC transporter permease [Paenibacillus dokdonensis]